MNSKNIKKSFLQESYPDIGKIISIKKIRHNDINSTNYLIKTKKENYLLKNLSSENFNKKKIVEIINFCNKNNAKVPFFIIEKKSNQKQTKKFLLRNYIIGKKFDGSLLEIKNVAKDLALLHKILNTYSRPIKEVKEKKEYEILTINEFNRIIDNVEKKRKKSSIDNKILKNYDFLKEIISTVKNERVEIKKNKLEKQMIHSDLHIENVIFRDHKVKSFIDFESMKFGYRLEDIAFTSIRFSFHNSKNDTIIIKKIKSFLETYKKYYPIKKKELIYLFQIFRYLTFQLLSYIIKKYYYNKSKLWINDFDKQLKLLKIEKEISQKFIY